MTVFFPVDTFLLWLDVFLLFFFSWLNFHSQTLHELLVIARALKKKVLQDGQ